MENNVRAVTLQVLCSTNQEKLVIVTGRRERQEGVRYHLFHLQAAYRSHPSFRVWQHASYFRIPPVALLGR